MLILAHKKLKFRIFHFNFLPLFVNIQKKYKFHIAELTVEKKTAYQLIVVGRFLNNLLEHKK